MLNKAVSDARQGVHGQKSGAGQIWRALAGLPQEAAQHAWTGPDARGWDGGRVGGRIVS